MDWHSASLTRQYSSTDPVAAFAVRQDPRLPPARGQRLPPPAVAGAAATLAAAAGPAAVVKSIATERAERKVWKPEQSDERDHEQRRATALPSFCCNYQKVGQFLMHSLTANSASNGCYRAGQAQESGEHGSISFVADCQVHSLR